MSFLDGLKDKAEAFGDKAKEGLAAAKDKASDLVGDVKERFDGDDSLADHPGMPAGEATDGIGDAMPASADTAAAGAPLAADSVAGSGQDQYDEVLHAAEDKAEALKTDPHIPAAPASMADPGDHRV